MKKLFLLLILTLFSAQGLAGGCPDGSDPVKSVSADGTYFVYNCGGQSSSSTKKSLTEIKKSIDDDGILQLKEKENGEWYLLYEVKEEAGIWGFGFEKKTNKIFVAPKNLELEISVDKVKLNQ